MRIFIAINVKGGVEMKLSLFLGGVVLFLVTAEASFSQDTPDFVIISNQCKSVVAYHVESEDNIKTFDSETSMMGCIRNSQYLICSFMFEEGQKRAGEKYRIVIESGPYLHFVSENGSEYFMVNKTSHMVSSSNRFTNIEDVEFSGSKVCIGVYVTKSEFDMLQKKNKQ